MHTAVVLPIAKSGQERLAGFLVAGISPRRALDDAVPRLPRSGGEPDRHAVANARAYEEERRRAEALAELDRAKTAFFSNVSHEFRTPLTLMLGPVEELLSTSRSELSPAAASQLEVVQRNGLRLLRLVNTLLDFSRIEAGRVRASYQSRPTSPPSRRSSPASSAPRSSAPGSVDRRVRDRSREPVFVDREMWEKIVLNLLSNAFKFTFEGEIERRAPAGRRRRRAAACATPAPGSPTRRCRASSSGSTGSRTREAARTRAAASGSRWCRSWSSLHGGTVSARACSARARPSRCRSRRARATCQPTRSATSRGRWSRPRRGRDPFVEEALRWLPDRPTTDGATGSDRPARYEALPCPRLRRQEHDDRPCVLVADDNADMRNYVARLLAEHYRVEAVPDGEARWRPRASAGRTSSSPTS